MSNIPHAGITPETYRILKNRCDKLTNFLGKDTRVGHLKRNASKEYEQWRKDGCGGKAPKTKTTIKTELSTFRSMIQDVAIKDKRAISNTPDIPKITSPPPPSEDEHRRNHFRHEELRVLIKTINELD